MINILVDYSIPTLLLANINKKTPNYQNATEFLRKRHTFSKKMLKKCDKKVKNHILKKILKWKGKTPKLSDANDALET